MESESIRSGSSIWNSIDKAMGVRIKHPVPRSPSAFPNIEVEVAALLTPHTLCPIVKGCLYIAHSIIWPSDRILELDLFGVEGCPVSILQIGNVICGRFLNEHLQRLYLFLLLSALLRVSLHRLKRPLNLPDSVEGIYTRYISLRPVNFVRRKILYVWIHIVPNSVNSNQMGGSMGPGLPSMMLWGGYPSAGDHSY